MSDDSSTEAGQPQESADTDTEAVPSLAINAQYIQDLSFENPRAPDSLASGQPEVKVSVEVTARQLGDARYESSIGINATAQNADQTVFLVELKYGGVFTLANIPADRIQLVCMIECPRMLFPFARRIIADVTRDGGFPPLMLDPIDFVRLYQQRRTQNAAAPASPDGSGVVN